MGKEIIFGAILLIASTAFFAFMPSTSDPLNVQFDSYIARYQKSYKSQDEYEYRRQIFRDHMEIIEEHNAAGYSWTLTANKFADLSINEIKAYMGLVPGSAHSGKELGTITGDHATGPNDVDIDWRKEKGYLIHVKNQGACGSCWAFAANTGVEAAWVKYNLLKYGKEITAPDLSEQCLVDCDNYSAGCMGGFMDNAYYYYTNNPTILASDYKYVAKDEDCRAKEYKPAVDELLLGWYAVANFDDNSLRATLNLGPVPVAIQAENPKFYLYEGGIIEGSECGYRLDHGVGLVAETLESDGGKYWTIRNSWGEGWGEDGHARIRRERQVDVYGRNVGVCGINTQNSIPTYMNYYH